MVDLLSRLKDTVDTEANYMCDLMEMMGSMDTLFAASEQSDVSNNFPLTSQATALTPSNAAALDTS